MWMQQYNTIRPYSALGYRPHTPAAIVLLKPEENLERTQIVAQPSCILNGIFY
jgi:hypothetical protein